MKVTRRNAMVMGALMPGGGFAVPGGGETDSTTQGINVKLFWDRAGCPCSVCKGKKAGWTVMVPDWGHIGDYWRPGMPVQYKYVPLHQFLEEVEQEFGMRPKA